MKSIFIRGLLPVALLSACLWLGCNKDNITTIPDQNVTASFIGQVIDEQNQPVAGAIVTAGEETRSTDPNGVFIFKNIPVKQHHAYLKVSHGSYFTSGRLMSVTAGHTHSATIQLLKKDFVYPGISASQGGSYTLPGNGPTLKFPAGAFKDGTTPYSSNVLIAAKHINPLSAGFADQIPGSLLGLRADGASEEVLASFGMIYVELQGSSGQALQIAEGKTVEITMPIPAGLLSTAPDEIPLWHFDEADGLWKEEGKAQKQGNAYVGEVSHFSCWNYDGSLPSIQISGQVVDQNGNPVSGIQISVEETATGWNIGHGNTGDNGMFSGPVAKDKPLTLKILDSYSCGAGQPLLTLNIGPFSADAVLPPIVITPNGINMVSISADLRDCNNAVMANAYLSVSIDGQFPIIFSSDASGHVQSSIIACNPNQLKIIAVNADALVQSAPYTYNLPPNTVNAGTLLACGQVTDHILYNLDGQSHLVLNIGVYAPLGSLYLGGSYGQNEYIQFNFEHNEQAGTYPLAFLGLSNASVQDTVVNNLNVLTNLTQYGANPGDAIIGTFSGDFQDGIGSTHNITGSYHVKHD